MKKLVEENQKLKGIIKIEGIGLITLAVIVTILIILVRNNDWNIK